MKPLMITALISCVVSITAFANDYRSFTDKKGRAIEAKIIKIDPSIKKVTLERKDKKQVTVLISVFSNEDQDYILNWKKSQPSNDIPQIIEDNSLLKKEIREIADRYKENRRQETWSISKKSTLYPDPYNQVEIKRVDTGKIFENGFELKVTLTLIPEKDWTNSTYQGGQVKRTGLVLLTPSGEVKYDSFTNPHPLESIPGYINTLGWDFVHKRAVSNTEFISVMERAGIPTFGVQPNSGKEDLAKAAVKVIEWYEDNGETHDKSEPKVHLPSSRFKDSVKSMKSSIKHF